MEDGYDRLDNEGSGGGSFVMGLLTGTVLGAGLGMLFAPKAGSELRNQISEQAGNLATAASDQYQRATEAASGWADRGKEVYDKTRDVITKGADEAQRYVKDATSAAKEAAKDWSSSGSPGGSSYGSSGSSYGSGPSSEQTRGSASEQTGGSRSGGPSSTGPSRRS
jgi:gas vesicle protein